MTPFEARLEVEAGRPAVILAGELDAATLPLLLDVLELVIERSRQDVVIDLTRLEFIGSAGIGALARAARDLEARHRTLRLRAPVPHVQRVLDLTGLAGHVEPPVSNESNSS